MNLAPLSTSLNNLRIVTCSNSIIYRVIPINVIKSVYIYLKRSSKEKWMMAMVSKINEGVPQFNKRYPLFAVLSLYPSSLNIL